MSNFEARVHQIVKKAEQRMRRRAHLRTTPELQRAYREAAKKLHKL